MISAGKPLQRQSSSQLERVRSGSDATEPHRWPRLPMAQQQHESSVVPDAQIPTDPLASLTLEGGSHRLLDPEEERALTLQVRDQKQLCESLMFQNPGIIQLALRELRALSAPSASKRSHIGSQLKKKRAYEVIVFDRNVDKPTGGGAGAIKRVTLNLQTVERLVARIESLVSIVIDPEVSPKERKIAKLEVDTRRERVARLLVECRFRRAVFKRLESEFIKRADQSKDGVISKAQHLSHFWESRSDLADRQKQVAIHSDLYEQGREQLMSFNCRLVRKLAAQSASETMPFNDLFQSGMTGLAEAIDLFEPDKGWRLSTYATPWISQKIKLCERGLKDLIYKKAYTEGLCSSVARFTSDYVEEHDCQPTAQQIAEGLGIKKDTVFSIQGILSPTFSIDASRGAGGGDEDGRTIAKTITTPKSDLPSEIDHRIAVSRLRQALQMVPDRQRLSIQLRHNLLSFEERENLAQQYGVTIDVDPSFKQIGRLLKVSNQRVIQIYKEGLADLSSRLLGLPWVSEDVVREVIERFNALSRASKLQREP